jgi:hypothetical protein
MMNAITRPVEDVKIVDCEETWHFPITAPVISTVAECWPSPKMETENVTRSCQKLFVPRIDSTFSIA